MILRNKDKERLIAIFESATNTFEVWAYGSRVNGDAHDGSDLDLVVRTPDLQKMPVDVFLALKEKIQESNIPIVVVRGVKPKVKKNNYKKVRKMHNGRALQPIL
jgi:predicted nucleotidyltransferase